MRRSKLLIPTFIIITVLSIFAYSLLDNYYESRNEMLERFKFNLGFAYESIFENHKDLSEIIFKSQINLPKITSILYDVYKSGKIEANRKRLADELNDFYNILSQYNIRQLHFHLNDNRSFYRFHRPEKYGDDLTNIRESIRLTNQNKTPTIGFEEGRIFNGFRYVYPLFHEDNHVGSVEISFSYNFINSAIFNVIGRSVDFMLKKNVVDQKVFEDEKSNYKVSMLNDNYVRDLSVLYKGTDEKFDLNIYQQSLSKQDYDKIKTSMNDGNFFTIETEYSGNDIVFVFMPVQNIKQETVAYLSTFFEDPYKRRLQYSTTLTLVSMILATASFFLLLINRERRLVAESKLSENLKNTIEQRDKLFSVISHDLRSPFMNLMGFTSLLKDELNTLDKNDLKDITETIHSSVSNTFNLLKQLLEWSRLQMDNVHVRKELVSLDKLVREEVNKMHEQLRSKKLRVELDLNEIQAEIDPEAYAIVVRNILSNAIKFSNTDSSVIVKLDSKEKNINLSIRDFGIGLDDELLIKLRMNQVHESNKGTAGEKGSGIGFWLINDYAKVNNGEIFIASKLNEGTTVHFLINQ
ncbi:MAG: hypothetical protein JW995_15740 [Melioribacteraceae bacterium]|nr:hypothetical protein [Melioribacteraceae bacterium]